jgi:hypothetical protein
MSLLEGGLLLLEPVLHLLTCAILLAELLLHHSERNGLLCQVSPQLLSLFGLLLGLDLPGPCPLEGGEVLLKLGLHRGEGRLLLCRCGLRLSQGGARLLQSLFAAISAPSLYSSAAFTRSTAEAPSVI